MLADDLIDQVLDLDTPEIVEPDTVAVLVSTQYLENYGAHDWDGQGEVPSYWKAKGGSEYLVTGVPAHLGAEEVLARIGARFEHSSDYSREYVIAVRVVAESYDPAAGIDPATDFYGEIEWLRSGLTRIAFEA
jgi:hypothetical protein